MRKFAFFMLALAFCLSACNEKTKGFKVDVSLANGNEKTVYLQKLVNDSIVTIDSAVIKDDLATLTAPIDNPEILYALKIRGMKGYMSFFADNKDVTIVGDLYNPEAVTIMASESQAELDAYYDQIQRYYAQMQSYDDAKGQAFANEDYTTVDSLVKITNNIHKEMDNYTNTFFMEHADNFIAHFILDEEKHNYPINQLKDLVSSFTSESIYKASINNYINKQERLEEGQPFIDFTLKTNNGTEVVLSEIIAQNKLTLVDFWASWCGPCRHENPVVKAAYEQFHNLGFDVIGVSIDQDEAAWRQAVKEDQLPWTHVRDSENKVSEDYMIYYIPSNFLYDQNGTMVAKGLRGEDLAAKLNELLK